MDNELTNRVNRVNGYISWADACCNVIDWEYYAPPEQGSLHINGPFDNDEYVDSTTMFRLVKTYPSSQIAEAGYRASLLGWVVLCLVERGFVQDLSGDPVEILMSFINNDEFCETDPTISSLIN